MDNEEDNNDEEKDNDIQGHIKESLPNHFIAFCLDNQKIKELPQNSQINVTIGPNAVRFLNKLVLH